MSTNFGAIPFNNGAAGNLTEFRSTGQYSRASGVRSEPTVHALKRAIGKPASGCKQIGNRLMITPVADRKTYSLSVLRNKVQGSPTTYTLSRSANGGSPTSDWRSWESLGHALSEIGVNETALKEGKEELDREGHCTISDVSLTQAQNMQILRFRF